VSRSRSPNYPQIGLKEAVQRVKSVYDSDYRSSLTRALTAERLGYSGVNGKSLAVIAALGKFGLLEGKGDDLRVSELTVRVIAHPPGSPERVQALTEAATRPDLFQAIAQRFPGKGASDGTLRAFLMTEGFIPPAADTALRAWRETQQMMAQESEIEMSGAQTVPTQMAVAPALGGETGLRRAVFGLAEGEVTVTAPVFLSAASVNDLQDYLDVFMKRARREAGLE
jgi:hypothetical protein